MRVTPAPTLAPAAPRPSASPSSPSTSAGGSAFHFQSPRIFFYIDEVFDADIPSRIIDLTRVQGPHSRSQYHPAFVLLLNPLGFGLRTWPSGAASASKARDAWPRSSCARRRAAWPRPCSHGS